MNNVINFEKEKKRHGKIKKKEQTDRLVLLESIKNMEKYLIQVKSLLALALLEIPDEN